MSRIITRTFRLFSEPSFWMGALSCFDLYGNTSYHRSDFNRKKPKFFKSDFEAIKSDWDAIGNDLKISMDRFKRGEIDRVPYRKENKE